MNGTVVASEPATRGCSGVADQSIEHSVMSEEAMGFTGAEDA